MLLPKPKEEKIVVIASHEKDTEQFIQYYQEEGYDIVTTPEELKKKTLLKLTPKDVLKLEDTELKQKIIETFRHLQDIKTTENRTAIINLETYFMKLRETRNMPELKKVIGEIALENNLEVRDPQSVALHLLATTFPTFHTEVVFTEELNTEAIIKAIKEENLKKIEIPEDNGLEILRPKEYTDALIEAVTLAKWLLAVPQVNVFKFFDEKSKSRLHLDMIINTKTDEILLLYPLQVNAHGYVLPKYVDRFRKLIQSNVLDEENVKLAIIISSINHIGHIRSLIVKTRGEKALKSGKIFYTIVGHLSQTAKAVIRNHIKELMLGSVIFETPKAHPNLTSFLFKR